jgi:hypothetical protein
MPRSHYSYEMCQRPIQNRARSTCDWVAVGVALICTLFSGCTKYAALPLDRSTPLASGVHLLQHTGFTLPERLGISEIDRLVVENNPDLIAARAQRGVAEAQVLQAGILPNPSISGAYAFLLGGPGSSPGRRREPPMAGMADSWQGALTCD